jgi:5'-3' exonuclease
MHAVVQANRDETPQEVARARAELPAVLHNMGINTLSVSGWEADDLIAGLVTELTDHGHTTLIFSSDKVCSAQNAMNCWEIECMYASTNSLLGQA